MEHVYAIIVAGGVGARSKHSTPKQYIKWHGKPLLTWVVERFLSHSAITGVKVVIHQDHQVLYQEAIASFEQHPKLLPAILGGQERQESVLKGMLALEALQPTAVLIHDAARPWFSKVLIDRLMDGMPTYPAIVPCIAIEDTVKRVEDNRCIETIDRTQLKRVQTPQAFHYGTLLDVLRKPSEQLFTDESSLCEAYDVPVHWIEGEKNNIKITTQEDIMHLQRQEQINVSYRIGMGYDAHRFMEVLPGRSAHVMLGGVAIPHPMTLEAHSDGDVLLHALVDALLGALGEGDIGMLFPPSDAQYKDVDSSFFVEEVMKRLETRQGNVVNADLTLIGEAPRIGPYREVMRIKVASLLKVKPEVVNIKATTTEKMGFTGRKEGIAGQAVVMVALPTSNPHS